MQRTVLRRTTSILSRRALSTAADDAASGLMTLNFNLPHETIYSGAKVSQVIVPGAAGEYGVTADHVPLVAQLKPGVLQILHEGTSEAEKYFVAGGFSVTHPNSTTVSIFEHKMISLIVQSTLKVVIYFRIYFQTVTHSFYLFFAHDSTGYFMPRSSKG